MNILKNYNKICDEVKDLALKYNRSFQEITIISVSKTFPAPIVQAAIDFGLKILGENKIQEAKDKFFQLKGDFKLHMIGHLQSNKVKEAVQLFDLIHSLDKISTVQKLNEAAARIDKIQNILIQVKTVEDPSKNGLSPNNIYDFLDKALNLKNINILGLMNMAPLVSEEKIILNSFKKTKELLDQINLKYNLNLKELSMGMSGDYPLAIKEGATMLRIGSSIFGPRTYQ